MAFGLSKMQKKLLNDRGTAPLTSAGATGDALPLQENPNAATDPLVFAATRRSPPPQTHTKVTAQYVQGDWRPWQEKRCYKKVRMACHPTMIICRRS